ncbi:MAG: hypothetical protein AB4426_07785 [Xenococcaceae cyanobacterium]
MMVTSDAKAVLGQAKIISAGIATKVVSFCMMILFSQVRMPGFIMTDFYQLEFILTGDRQLAHKE